MKKKMLQQNDNSTTGNEEPSPIVGRAKNILNLWMYSWKRYHTILYHCNKIFLRLKIVNYTVYCKRHCDSANTSKSALWRNTFFDDLHFYVLLRVSLAVGSFSRWGPINRIGQFFFLLFLRCCATFNVRPGPHFIKK
ncbi:unnamed protein product [Clavelina lepadiformis]|uniref:Uncharacterized protein n=1 Tax=Clavelina lepadiformis TaxID=159417 RepID=A0ABP0FI08_CLALP